ncbi:MAG: VWA domain-containing protein, partial [Planctomycetota bacterium]
MIEFGDPVLAWWLVGIAAVAIAVRFTLVDRPRRLLIGSAALRALAVLLLILAMMRPTTPGTSERVHAAFMLDVSASVDLEAAVVSLDRVDQAIAALGSADTWSLALLGDGLRSIESTDAARTLLDTWQRTGGDEDFRAATRVADALDLVRLSLPADAASRVVLLTDIKPTGAPLKQAIERLASEGVSLSVDRVPGLDQPEAGIVSLVPTPASAFEGELVRFRARIVANHDGPAELRIVHRGVVVTRRDVSLQPGDPIDVDVTVPMITPGRSVWRAELAPAEDFFAINNAATCAVQVSGRPRVLVLHTEPREMRAFERAMERQDLIVETRPPRGMPTGLDELLAFDAVVLADIPATDLSSPQLEMLRRYVSDFAGGLAMLGSENSFGLGGYYRTPVEEALPLVSRFEKEREEPSIAMLLVIDKSGSMSGTPIALARQAAKATADLIGARDQIGVVGFDDRAFIASDLEFGSAKDTVKLAIDRLDAGGGTFMFAGMQAGQQMLDNAIAQIKHMIVLSDGVTNQADHDGLVRELLDRGVTVSTVALGTGADRALLSRLAEIGRGRYYETIDPADVPQIFTRETVQASRSAIREDLFASIKLTDHPMLDGIAESDLPFSLGFVMTRPKPTARVLLATETGEPLLAVNNYGLGATLAFTSDLTPRWGAEWIAWPGFGKFWAQAIRSLVRRPDAGQTSVATTI